MSSSSSRKHIVFDFGAVLFQWRPAQMLQRELPQVATDEASAQRWVTEFFQAYQGDWGEFDRGTVEVPDLVARISRRTGLKPADVQKVVDAVPLELQPVATAVELLQGLHRAGHTLHYLSNMPKPYAKHLLRYPFMACFTSGLFSSDVHHNKPEPAIFAAAQALFEVPVDRLVFLDDMPANVLAARALRWNAIQFNNATQARAELLNQGFIQPDHAR